MQDTVLRVGVDSSTVGRGDTMVRMSPGTGIFVTLAEGEC